MRINRKHACKHTQSQGEHSTVGEPEVEEENSDEAQEHHESVPPCIAAVKDEERRNRQKSCEDQRDSVTKDFPDQQGQDKKADDTCGDDGEANGKFTPAVKPVQRQIIQRKSRIRIVVRIELRQQIFEIRADHADKIVPLVIEEQLGRKSLEPEECTDGEQDEEREDK